MLIGYSYLDQYGYCYGVQNQANYLQTKYSNIYYKLTEIEKLYTPAEIVPLYEPVEITGLYSVIEIVSLYTVVELTE